MRRPRYFLYSILGVDIAAREHAEPRRLHVVAF